MEASNLNELSAQSLVWNHTFGVVNSMMLKVAIDLNIPDAIQRHPQQPVSLAALSASLSVPCTNMDTLRRIMRFLAHMELVTIINTDTYELKPASLYLIKGFEKSLEPFVQFFMGTGNFSTWVSMGTGCLNGARSAFEMVSGESFYIETTKRPNRSKRFNKAMQAMQCCAALLASALVKGYFDGFMETNSLVDVGGGTGTISREIVKAFPHIKCTIFDLPVVVEESKLLPTLPINYVAGDMFCSVPQADAVILSWILHNWNDEECLVILKRCKEALPKGKGKVIIVDIVIDDENKAEKGEDLSHARLAFDMIMMAYMGGKERTEKEWRKLLLTAGFSRCKIIPLMALNHVIEACP